MSLPSAHHVCSELRARQRHSTPDLRSELSEVLALRLGCGPPPRPGPAPLGALGFCDDTLIPQRCCPARGMLRAVAESVETQPLLRVSLAVLTIGSLLVIAVVNLVGAGAGAGGPGQHPSG